MQVKVGAGVSGERAREQALTNLYRHSEGQEARIDLKQEAASVTVGIRDFGKGIPKAASPERFLGARGFPEAAPQPARASEDSTHAWFLYGMRLGEIRNLKWEHINLQEHTIRLYAGQTKNDEARIIPLKAERF